MARYIDADKTLDMMWNALYQYEDDMEKKNGLNLTERLDVQNGFEIAHKVVVDAPTEDVAPVAHAHWKRNFQRQGVYKDLWLYCSNCNGRTSEEYAPYWWLYCPYCGARMEVE